MLFRRSRGLAAALLAAVMALPAQGWAAESTSDAVPAPTAVPPGMRFVEPPLAPEPAISKEEALAAVKRWFELPEGPGRLDVQLNRYGAEPVWEILYSIDFQNGSSTMSVGRVDALSGRILQMSIPGMGYYQPIRTGPLQERYSEEEARAKAWELVRAMLPERAARLKPAPAGLESYYSSYSLLGNTWSFTWVDEVDGAAFPLKNVTVSVDKETLNITSFFGGQLLEATFPTANVKLSSEEAMERFRSLTKPELSYQPIRPRGSYGQRAVGMRLVYRFDRSFVQLDPATGEPVLMSRLYGSSEPTYAPITAAEGIEPVHPSSLPVTAEAAQAMLAPLLERLPEGSRIEVDPYFRSFDPYDTGERVSLRIEGPDGSQGSISVDSATGRVRSANRWIWSEGAGTEYSEEAYAKALAAATELVQLLYGDLLPDLKVSDQSQAYYADRNRARFYFQRFVNEIPVSGDGIHLAIDLDSMAWTEISFNWTEGVQFPAPTTVISPEEAAAIFLAGRQPLLLWQLEPIDPPYPTSSMAPQPERKAYLAYQLSRRTDRQEPAHLDAFTGQELDHNGSRVIPFAEIERMLAGHWAEGELRFLVASSAMDLEQVNLNESLSRGEAIQLLIHGARQVRHGFGGRVFDLEFTDLPRTSPYYQSVLEAVRMGLLRSTSGQFNPDRELTRIDAAVWLANGLGLGRLMESEIRLEHQFTDLDELSRAERNAVILLEAMGIVSPGSQFRPHDPMTAAETATLFVKYYNELLRNPR